MINTSKKLWKYSKKVLIALDQLINTIFNGYEDESLSSRFYRLSKKGEWYCKIPCKLIDTVLFFDTKEFEDNKIVKHCEKSYLHEKERTGCPPELRK